MTLLQVASLAFGYGADRLFQGVTFSLALGERMALVAPNGAGKSTLLRLIAAELSPDEGQVVVRKGVTVGYYRQSHELPGEGDVMGAFLSGFGEVLDLRRRLHVAQEEAASGEAAALDRLAALMDAYQRSHGDELERKVTMLAERLGFTSSDMERPLGTLSGGERGRLLLGVVLARDPDLLLLDEPTNHLDLDTIRWLEGYLQKLRGAVLVVSHDRAFLDAVTAQTCELGRRSFRVFPAAYSAYEVLREEELERERELAERQEAMVAKTEEFIRRNIAGQKTKQAQSRRKMLDKLDRLERPEDVWARAERVAFRFVPAPRSGDIVLEGRAMAARRAGRTLFQKTDLLIRRGDRLAVVGPNGSGKSTLLKILAGVPSDGDEGSVRRGTNLCDGYFDQHLGSLDERRSAVDEIRSIKADMNVDATRQYLSRFRFYGDDVFRTVAGFSGGERSRLALAKLLLEPRNLLFLDEPTNHLDIPAAQILEEALQSFEGTVVMVSHDRRFLENVATRIVHVRDGQVEAYQGTFADWSEQRERQAEQAAAPAEVARREKSAGKAAFEDARAAARAAERKRRRLAELEELIARGEAELAAHREALRQVPGDNWEELALRAEQEQALVQKVDDMMQEWTELGDELAQPEGAS